MDDYLQTVGLVCLPQEPEQISKTLKLTFIILTYKYIFSLMLRCQLLSPTQGMGLLAVLNTHWWPYAVLCSLVGVLSL